MVRSSLATSPELVGSGSSLRQPRVPFRITSDVVGVVDAQQEHVDTDRASIEVPRYCKAGSTADGPDGTRASPTDAGPLGQAEAPPAAAPGESGSPRSDTRVLPAAGRSTGPQEPSAITEARRCPPQRESTRPDRRTRDRSAEKWDTTRRGSRKFRSTIANSRSRRTSLSPPNGNSDATRSS